MSNEKAQNNTIVDCQGLACPQPVILTKKALDQRPESLTVIVDNAAAKENVAKFATAGGYGVSIEEMDGLYQVRLLAGTNFDQTTAAPTPVTELPTTDERPVFLISKDTLGQGSEALGAILIKAFFVSLLEVKPLPKTIMLINSGVYLAAEESPVLPAMQELSGRGVNILVCGTCLDYFELKEKLAVGSVTNMYSILSELTGSSRAITL